MEDKYMKKNLKKSFCIVMASILMFCLNACGVGDKTAESGNENTDKAEALGNNDSEHITLEIWTLLDQTDSDSEAWEKAISDYEAAHSNIKINRSQYEGEAYKIKLKSAVAADELPDIFFSWAGGFSQPFIEAGKMLPLDDAYEMYASDIEKSKLDSSVYDGVLYGTSIGSQMSLLYYNKEMFEENGLSVPETYEDLLKVCQKFIDNGITPFAISAKDTWGLAVFYDNLALKTIGKENVINTITRNGGSFKDKGFQEAAEKFVKLVDMGAFLDNAPSLNTDEAYQYFVNGTCPMWLMIDSLGNTVLSSMENPGDYGVVRFPVINDNAAITDVMGGSGEIFCVSSGTKYPDEATNAVFEIIQSVARYSQELGTAMSIWNGNVLDEDSPEYLKMNQEFKSEITSSMLWWDTTMTADDAQEYLGLLQELYTGNITPEEFCDAMNTQLTN